jgi:predicted phage terminase large subunit-like protein
LRDLSEEEAEAIEYDWSFWARPKQLPPKGDWPIWVLRAGRGFGKTRSISGWMHQRAMEHPKRWIALVARTPSDARDYNIEGPGGILRNTAKEERPDYESSKRRLTWPNGSWATIYSDEEPDQLRGFSGDTAILDEFAKFKHAQECWDNLQFGMREASNDQPRIMVATTPRPLSLLKKIEKIPGTVTVTGSSYENRSNLDPAWFKNTLSRYANTRLGRQEIEAEYVDDVPNALWTHARIDQHRVQESAKLERIVVGVDPSGAAGEVEDGGSNDIGISAVGLGVDKHLYVLDDFTCQLSPMGWGRRVAELYGKHKADLIVAEKNFGGAMVEHVIRTTDRLLPVKMVQASRGKWVRAEPVAALYEQGRVHHVGMFPELEDQMCAFSMGGYVGPGSPDRVDALVWAITELALNQELYYDSSMSWVGV